MSLFWLPPVIWFAAVGGDPASVSCSSRDDRLPLGVASFCLLLAVLAWPVQPEIQRIYSPYQLLERTAKPDGLMQYPLGRKLLSEGLQPRGQQSRARVRKQIVMFAPITSFRSTSRRRRSASPSSARAAATTWRLRCAWARPMSTRSRSIPPSRSSASSYHPEHPYDDPRVTLSINDARNFFRTANQQYDLIVYGVLDSHTALSHASNLRVDSYVYTREGIAEAFRLLKPDGVLSIAFTLTNDALGFKLSHILRDMPGAGKPLAVRVLYDFSRTHRLRRQEGPGTSRCRCQRLCCRSALPTSPTISRNPIRKPHPDRRLAVLLHGRRAPIRSRYMIALGMVLLLSILRAQDHRLYRSDRPQLPAVLLFRLRLHAGGDQGHHRARSASWRHLVRDRGGHPAGVGHGVPGQPDRDAVRHGSWRGLPISDCSPACWLDTVLRSITASGCSDSPLMQLALSCVVLTIPLFFAGIIFSSLIGEAKINISTAFAYNLMGALIRRRDGIQFDVFRICIPLSACAWDFIRSPGHFRGSPGNFRGNPCHSFEPGNKYRPYLLEGGSIRISRPISIWPGART